MAAGDQPGDRALDHRSPPAVRLGEVTLPPAASCLGQLSVVVADMQQPAVLGCRAAFDQRAGPAAEPEAGLALDGDGDGVSRRAGAGVVVDDEVVPVEASRHGGPEWDRLDRLVMADLAASPWSLPIRRLSPPAPGGPAPRRRGGPRR